MQSIEICHKIVNFVPDLLTHFKYVSDEVFEKKTCLEIPSLNAIMVSK